MKQNKNVCYINSIIVQLIITNSMFVGMKLKVQWMHFEWIKWIIFIFLKTIKYDVWLSNNRINK